MTKENKAILINLLLLLGSFTICGLVLYGVVIVYDYFN